MLDIKFIRENKELVEKNNKSRNANVDLDTLLRLDKERLVLMKKADDLRAERKKRSKTKPGEEEIKLVRKMGDEITGLEDLLDEKTEEMNKILWGIPNINHDSVPISGDESGNEVVRKEGEAPDFAFEPREHFDVGSVKPLMDLERGAETSGSRFYYLKGKLAILERALMQYAVDFIVARGFELVLPPLMVKEGAMFGTGFFPADKNEVYEVNPDEDQLYLIGTSEVPLIYYHSDQILSEKDLTKKYVSITPCFRRESGSYGKDTKGLFRVHQFYKVEMIVFSRPEDSWKIHDELLKNEEDILQSLGLHYQIVNVCSGDLGFPAAKKYDCEGWFPGQGKYRELTSTSNTTDYQARRSNIKFKTADGKKEFVYTLNGTVITDRAMLAIIENYQDKDGGVTVPEVLRKYTGFDKI